MGEKLFVILAGAIAGAVGYWVTTFWMKPILQYREIRSKVLSDLILYAQVINAIGLNDQMKDLYEERVRSNRQRAADLSACLLDLPSWYLWWLRHLCAQVPRDAATDLIGLSNTTDYKAANECIDRMKISLGIKGDLV